MTISRILSAKRQSPALRGLIRTGHNRYFLKPGYRSRAAKDGPRARQLGTPEMAADFQVPVYRFARQIVRRHKLRSVLDLGCGWGVKLREFLFPVCGEITGVDLAQEKIVFCRAQYSFGEWICADLEDDGLSWERKFDLVICADMIEHVFFPDRVMSLIKKNLSPAGWAILSTPERDIHRGRNHGGPPPNALHVREWNRREFSRYVRSRGLKVIEHRIVARGRLSREKSCQMLLCRPEAKASR